MLKSAENDKILKCQALLSEVKLDFLEMVVVDPYLLLLGVLRLSFHESVNKSHKAFVKSFLAHSSVKLKRKEAKLLLMLEVLDLLGCVLKENVVVILRVFSVLQMLVFGVANLKAGIKQVHLVEPVNHLVSALYVQKLNKGLA